MSLRDARSDLKIARRALRIKEGRYSADPTPENAAAVVEEREATKQKATIVKALEARRAELKR